jgi:hypothetical protein
MATWKTLYKWPILLIIGMVSCQNDPVSFDAPSCVHDFINQLQTEPVRNPPASVWRYLYNGKTVYYIPPTCCDVPSVLLDDACTILCSPDGGISGDGRRPDFIKTRQNEELIWKDTRK